MKESEIIKSVKSQCDLLKIKKVLIALSGGPDSVAAAFALLKAGIQIKALHCNFHLRGAESDRDQLFTEEFCKTYEIPLQIRHFDVALFISSHPSYSIEMACRELRYEWFDSVLKTQGFDRLATGHNADDNIETFFLNLLRGAGTRGLKGMSIDNGIIWHPLLKFHRKDILILLNDNNLNFITDSSNLKSDFRRNFLRNEVIPLLKSEWKGFDKAIDTSISHLKDENEIIEGILNHYLSENQESINADDILKFPAPLLLIRRFIDNTGPYSTTPDEILSAIKANKPHIRRWTLKKGEVILRNKRLFIKMSHGERCPRQAE